MSLGDALGALGDICVLSDVGVVALGEIGILGAVGDVGILGALGDIGVLGDAWCHKYP